MPVYFDKDKKRWRFTFSRVIAGARYRTSKLLPQGWGASRADAFDRKESARIYAEAAGIEQREPLISEAIRLYGEHRIPELDNGRKVVQELAHLFPYYSGRTMDELSEIAHEYKREHPLLKPATVKNRLSYLRAACRYAWKYHKLGSRDKIPGGDMAMPTVRNERQVYVRTEGLDALLGHIEDTETRALVTLEFYTGMRWRSEILKLTAESIVRDGEQVWLVANDRKNDEAHMVPVHPAALWAIEHIPFAWGDSYYYRRYWAARKAAGMPHVRKHDLRHSLASALISSGSTLAEVGNMLGQKSLQSTKRYAHLYRDRLAEIMNRVGVSKKVPTRKTKKKAAKKLCA